MNKSDSLTIEGSPKEEKEPRSFGLRAKALPTANDRSMMSSLRTDDDYTSALSNKSAKHMSAQKVPQSISTAHEATNQTSVDHRSGSSQAKRSKQGNATGGVQTGPGGSKLSKREKASDG